MYKYSRWFLLLMGLLIFPIADAQTEAQPASASLNHIKESTETSLFTGRMSYSIPIYTIEDPDFHLDIALRYSAEGFKPFQPSGFYGQDWSLLAGGRITREPMGRSDEYKTIYMVGRTPSDQHVGMLQAIKDGDNPIKEEVFDFTSPLYKPTCGIQYYADDYIPYANYPIGSYCEWERDYMPDIYHFSFEGHSGKFLINNAGQAVIVSGDFVDVDVSNLREIDEENYWHNSFYEPSDSSQIIIRTKDGYTYVFGGSHNAVEYSTYIGINSPVDQFVPAINAWYVTKIVAPNGRHLLFSYKNVSSSYPDQAINSGLYSFLTDYDWSEQYINSDYAGDTTHIMYCLQKGCLLESISTSDSIPLTVMFNSIKESQPMYNHADFQYSKPHLQLDSISVVYGERVLRTAKLSYYYRNNGELIYPPVDNNYYWRYLRQISISGVGTYIMNYTYKDPAPQSPNPNMQIHTLNWYPSLYPKTNTSYKNMVDRMGFWKLSSLQGMLSEVLLPTGGKIKFTFNNHQHAEERRFRAVGSQDVELYSHFVDNQTIGGARIEKIETFSNDSTIIETKTFSYTKPNSNTSSGVFYNIYEIFNVNNSGEGRQITNPINYGMIDSHIGYSYVQCITTSGYQTYKTAYTFDTGLNTYSSINNNTINRRTNTSGYSATDELLSGSLTYDAHLTPTGKLLAVEQYNGNVIQRATYFRYNGIANTAIELPAFEGTHLGCIDTIVCLSTYSGNTARKLFVYPDVLEHAVTYEYGSDGNAMMSEKTYSYDTKLRKREVVTTDNNGMKRFTRYAYPDDFIFSTWDVLFDPPAVYSLQEIHRINTPVEQVSGYMENGNEYITSGKVNLYKNMWKVEFNNPSYLPIRPDWDSLIIQIPDSIIHSGTQVVGYYPYLNKTLRLSLTEPIPISNYQWMSANGKSVLYDPRYKLDCEYQFDIMDRITSIKPFGATETTYTWNGLYPSSKTIGNQTTTYTYIPYVGVSSITDPRGTTTYYTYDASGRLIETYRLVEGKKQILNVYQYHIKTE